MQSKYIVLSFFFLLCNGQLKAQSVNIMDSLKLYPDAGEVVERKFQGIIPAASCAGIEYTLYLYNQIYSGDGVYKLSQKYLDAENGKDIVFTTYGKQYTLRGDAENINAVVYQLIEFPCITSDNCSSQQSSKIHFDSVYRNCWISASPSKKNKSENVHKKTLQIINLLYHNDGNLEILNSNFERITSDLNYILVCLQLGLTD